MYFLISKIFYLTYRFTFIIYDDSRSNFLTNFIVFVKFISFVEQFLLIYLNFHAAK